MCFENLGVLDYDPCIYVSVQNVTHETPAKFYEFCLRSPLSVREDVTNSSWLVAQPTVLNLGFYQTKFIKVNAAKSELEQALAHSSVQRKNNAQNIGCKSLFAALNKPPVTLTNARSHRIKLIRDFFLPVILFRNVRRGAINKKPHS